MRKSLHSHISAVIAVFSFCIMSEIFADPVVKSHKDRESIAERELKADRAWFKRESAKKVDYLTLLVKPKGPLSNESETSNDANRLFLTSQESEGPSLREFLNFLEAEKLLALTEASDSEEASGEITKVTPLLGFDPNALDQLEADAEAPLNDEVEVTLQTADPLLRNPMFPRPESRRGSSEEFFIYFPVDDLTEEKVRIVSPGAYEAIFSPPVTTPMRSSATLTEGP